jgi:hypothetical protein
VPFGFVYSFSPEFRTLGVDKAVLDQIRARGAGEVASVGNAALKLAERRGVETIRLWPLLLIGALCLVPVDILLRRLG